MAGWKIAQAMDPHPQFLHDLPMDRLLKGLARLGEAGHATDTPRV